MKHASAMADPLKELGWRERLTAGLWLLMLIAFLATISIMFGRSRNTEGKLIEGRVESFGVPVNKWGDMVVTVRLANGSVREVLTKWELVKACERGDRIALVQRGLALNVGVMACNPLPN